MALIYLRGKDVVSMNYRRCSTLQPNPTSVRWQGKQEAPNLKRATERVLQKRNLLKRIKLIWVVQSHLQKYSASHLTQITSRTPAVPLLTRGVSRSSRT